MNHALQNILKYHIFIAYTQCQSDLLVAPTHVGIHCVLMYRRRVFIMPSITARHAVGLLCTRVYSEEITELFTNMDSPLVSMAPLIVSLV